MSAGNGNADTDVVSESVGGEKDDVATGAVASDTQKTTAAAASSADKADTSSSTDKKDKDAKTAKGAGTGTDTSPTAGVVSSALPLQYKWTLWYNAPSQSWDDRKVLPIGFFATVADFWRLFNNISPPSRMQGGSDYHLFKGKIKPEWEDRFNAKGGCWVFRFNRINDLRDIDHAWYECILNMVGHNFEYSDDICGVVISIRRPMRRGKLSLWLRDASNDIAVRSLGRKFKSFCPGVWTVEFQSHENAKKKIRKPDIEL